MNTWIEKWGGRRYNSFNHHLKMVFGEKVYRVAIDAGFTCPNRNGLLAYGGCIYCDEAGSRASYVEPARPVREQLQSGIELLSRKYNVKKFIAYFQSFSNTYASVERLKSLFDEALSVDGVVGISVSTRPDLLPDEILDLLEEFSKRTYLWLEIGVQSIHLRTLKKIRRFHGVAEIVDSILRAKARGIRVLAHVILGLPGESEFEIIETARVLSAFGVDGVKMHHLYVVEGTELAKIYRAGRLKVFETPEDYARVAVRFIEHLSPEIIIHRLAGKAERGLIAPKWTSNKFLGIQAIEKMLEERDTYQGRFSQIGIPYRVVEGR